MDNDIKAIDPWDDIDKEEYADYNEQSVRASVEEDIRMTLLEEGLIEEEEDEE